MNFEKTAGQRAVEKNSQTNNQDFIDALKIQLPVFRKVYQDFIKVEHEFNDLYDKFKAEKKQLDRMDAAKLDLLEGDLIDMILRFIYLILGLEYVNKEKKYEAQKIEVRMEQIRDRAKSKIPELSIRQLEYDRAKAFLLEQIRDFSLEVSERN